MCGFVGFVRHTENARAVVKAMADTIAHRGPDDEGYYLDGDVAFGFRRLSIIDLSTGSQPMFNEDGTVAIVFNGEIYNYESLRETLVAKGHVFVTSCDTETLVHAYEEYGEGMLSQLRGMYAFVIYDAKRQRIFAARDIFGIKPFYYYHRDGVFLFASEIKAFLAHPDFVKELDESLIPTYMSFEYVPGEATLFKGVKKLLAGHCLSFGLDGKLEVSRYHQIRYDLDESRNMDTWANDIGEAFRESCHAHMIADVEVGCFLSSGVDSSLVTLAMSGENDVKSFSIGYDEEKYSELSDSSELSRAIGVANYPAKVGAKEFFRDFGTIQYHMDEPLPNPSAVPLYFLAEHAAKQVKVVLSGEGADELFGGYGYYQECIPFSKYNRIPRPIRRAIGKVARRLPKFRGRRFLIRGGDDLETRYVRNTYVFTEAERADLLLKDNAPAPDTFTKDVFGEIKGFDEITRMQYADIYVWMQYDILQKADKMSMAHSLELRVPFLDRNVLDVAVKIPSRYRVSSKETKLALREYAKSVLPAKTASMRKRGFPSPLAEWIRQEPYASMIENAFRSETSKMFFKQEPLMAMLADHVSGKTNDMKRLWTVYTFLVWYEEFFEKRA